ncbi:MAG: RHS repeat-associated core domain-containing protein, partial [Helicobacteraceae bacterium]|nr:RHS repeat-associated core domain-containing protein [Helicobacteraceae bacterium]
AVYDGNGVLKYRFEYAGERTPIAYTNADNQIFYLSYNHLGSLKAVRNSSGVIKRIDYDSFGNVINDTNPDLNVPIGSAGGLYDQDTKLVRFGYRDYDPFTGRWTAKDPIDFNGGSSNLYGYVGNDPINYVDPTGEFWRIIIGGIAAYYAIDAILNLYEYLSQAKIKIDNPQDIGTPAYRDQLRGALDDTNKYCRENAPLSPLPSWRLPKFPKDIHNDLVGIGENVSNDLLRGGQDQNNVNR